MRNKNWKKNRLSKKYFNSKIENKNPSVLSNYVKWQMKQAEIFAEIRLSEKEIISKSFNMNPSSLYLRSDGPMEGEEPNYFAYNFV